MMKDTYSREEVIAITNNFTKQIAKLRKQLDDNARKFAKMMHESIDLVWMLLDNDDEEDEFEEDISSD